MRLSTKLGQLWKCICIWQIDLKQSALKKETWGVHK